MNVSFRFFLGLLLCVLCVPALADVTLVGSSSGSDTSDDAEFTFTISVPVNTELAVVGVTNRSARNTSWVRFDGQANMTFVINSISSPNSDMDERAQLYYFLNPPAGNQTVRVSLSGNTRHKAAGCLLFNGINSTSILSPVAKCDEDQVADNPTPTLSFTGTEARTGSMVVSVINNRGGNLAIGGATHTQRWNIETSHALSLPSSRHGGGTAPGSSTSGVSVSWTPTAGWPTEANWGMVAMVIPAMYSGPSNILPDTLTVNDNDPNNTVIGTLTATDPDNKPPYTWTLPNNAEGRFALNSSTSLSAQVKIANEALIDYGLNTSHVIRVGIKNSEYPTAFEKDITINVLDKTPPVIGSITASRQWARFGELVYFSASITDNAALGAPTMTLGGTPLTFSGQSGDVFTWAWNVPLGTPDGSVDVQIQVADASGNTVSRLGEDLVTVDNTLPTLSALTVSPSYAKTGDTVEIGIDILDFYGVALFPTATLAGVDCGEPVLSGFRYTWQMVVTAGMPEGPAEVIVTAQDLAGNSAQGNAADLITIDHTLPSISAFASTHYYARLNDIVTLQAAVLDNYGLAAVPQMRINGFLLDNPTAAGNTFYWQLTITESVLQGIPVIEVSATDRAGNTRTASPPSTILIVDYTQPNISQLNVAPALAKPGMTITVSARIQDNYGLNGTPSLTFNGIPTSAPTQAGYVYTWTYIVPANAAEGPVVLNILALDLAGNMNYLTDTTRLTFDPNGPIITAASATPNQVRQGQTSTLSVNIADISPLQGLPSMTINGTAASHSGSTGQVHTFSYPITGSTPEGDASVVVNASDILGNTRNANFTGVLLVDKTPPVISNIAANPSLARHGSVVRITFDAADTLTDVFGTPSVAVNGAPASFYSRSGNHFEFRYTVRAPALDPDGQIPIFVSCRDVVGNSTSAQRDNILIIDNSVPAVSDLTVFPGNAKEGTRVTIGFSATDAGGLGSLPDVKVNNVPASFVAAQGSYFEYQYTVHSAYDDEGYALISIRIVDSIGNVSNSESTGLLLVDFTPPTGTVSINDNDIFTRLIDVSLGMTCSDGALGSGTESMSFSDDGLAWSPWEPLLESREWQLKPIQGYKTIYMRLRDRAGNISTTPMTDTIALNLYPLIVDREGPGDIKGNIGYAVVLEVSARNVFGSIQSYEWFKNNEPINFGTKSDDAAGPVLALEDLNYSDEGSYTCTVSDELETATSPPFNVSISTTVPVAGPVSCLALILILAFFVSRKGLLLIKHSKDSL